MGKSGGASGLWPVTACVSVTVPPCRWPCKWTQVSAGLTEGLPRPAPGHPQAPRLTHTRSRASGPEAHLQGLLRPPGPRWLPPAGDKAEPPPSAGNRPGALRGQWTGQADTLGGLRFSQGPCCSGQNPPPGQRPEHLRCQQPPSPPPRAPLPEDASQAHHDKCPAPPFLGPGCLPHGAPRHRPKSVAPGRPRPLLLGRSSHCK